MEIVNHSSGTAFERLVKKNKWRGVGEGGLNRFYVATTLALNSAMALVEST